jgi:hypothetical protein
MFADFFLSFFLLFFDAQHSKYIFTARNKTKYMCGAKEEEKNPSQNKNPNKQ